MATMSRVIQIRDVPDDVHDALARRGRGAGSLPDPIHAARIGAPGQRAQAVHANAAVIRQTQAEVRGHVDRATILAALHEGRGD